MQKETTGVGIMFKIIVSPVIYSITSAKELLWSIVKKHQLTMFGKIVSVLDIAFFVSLSAWLKFDIEFLLNAAFVVFGLLCFAYFYDWITSTKGRSEGNETHIRGARLMQQNELQNYIKKNSKAQNLVIAGVPVPQEVEPLNFILAGGPGTGKSLIIKEVATQLRHGGRGDIVICADPNGDLMKTFFKDGDKVLNPLDSRCANWALLAEGVHGWEASRLAKAMIPDGLGHEAQWSEYAQNLCAAVIQKLPKSSTNGDLIDALTIWNSDKLAELVTGTPAALYFLKGSQRMLDNIRSVMSKSLTPYQYLNREASVNDFSIRQFVTDAIAAPADKKPWLWMPYTSDQRALLRPLLSAWLELVSTSVLQLQPDSKRRVWLFVDELPALGGGVTSLPEVLAEGRKSGFCCVAGLQNISQLRENFGRENASTLLSCFQTIITFRVSDFDTAEHMSKALGEAEVDRARHSSSTSDNGNSTSTNIERKTERVVVTSDIQKLAARVGFMNIAGPIPICPIEVAIADYVVNVEPFVLNKQLNAGAIKVAEEAPEAFKLEFDAVSNAVEAD
jgi:hypothetical protein